MISGLGRAPGEGKGCPLQYSGLENSMDCIVHGVAKSRTRLNIFIGGQRSLECHSPWGHKEPDRTQWPNNNNKKCLPNLRRQKLFPVFSSVIVNAYVHHSPELSIVCRKFSFAILSLFALCIRNSVIKYINLRTVSSS